MAKEIDEKQAKQEIEQKLDQATKDLNKKVAVALIGQVSAGKSSLLNAMFKRGRDNPLAKVGAVSGVTTEAKSFPISKNVTVLDLPGLDDIKASNSAVTLQRLLDIDVGILVVAGSADSGQKKNYDLLKQHCKYVFVVLNKIDEYDKKPSALEKVKKQWHEQLGLSINEKIFPICVEGYDPDYDPDIEMDIRGVDELMEAIYKLLEKEGKAIVLQRETMKKSELARRAVYTALVAVAVEAFIPGSAIYITATQAVAIASIHYIYTGEVISKNHVFAVLPLFAAQSVGSSLFLVVKSVLPPTGVVDAMAAGVAVSVTLAMLSSVNWVYENGYNLDNKKELKVHFNEFYKLLKDMGVGGIFDVVKSGDTNKIIELIAKFIK